MCIDQVVTLFTSGQFYFSLDVDLTNSAQATSEKLGQSGVANDGWRRVVHDHRFLDERYVFNQCSRERAGLRFRRGVNDKGNAAVEVETETRIVGLHHTCSFRMIRGSLPLKWRTVESDGNSSARIDLTEAPTRSSRAALDRHLTNLVTRYGADITILDLFPLGRPDYEALGDIFESTLIDLKRRDCSYLHYDGARVMGGDLRVLDALREDVERPLIRQGFFSAGLAHHGYPTSLLSKQSGIFRLNGLNCVDTTNLSEQAIGEIAVEIMLSGIHNLSLLHGAGDEEYADTEVEPGAANGRTASITAPPATSSWASRGRSTQGCRREISKFLSASDRRRLAGLWRSNGDGISQQYVGTRAVQEAHLSGRSWWRRLIYLTSGRSVMATAIRIARTYMDAFQFDRRQEAFELVLGPEDGGGEEEPPMSATATFAPPLPPSPPLPVPLPLVIGSPRSGTGSEIGSGTSLYKAAAANAASSGGATAEFHKRAMRRRRLISDQESQQPAPVALTLALRRLTAPHAVRGLLDFAAASTWLLLSVALAKVGLARSARGAGVFEAASAGRNHAAAAGTDSGSGGGGAGVAASAAPRGGGAVDLSEVPVIMRRVDDDDDDNDGRGHGTHIDYCAFGVGGSVHGDRGFARTRLVGVDGHVGKSLPPAPAANGVAVTSAEAAAAAMVCEADYAEAVAAGERRQQEEIRTPPPRRRHSQI
ncbi:hypothetical protein HK405_010610 [Cladochytrium tenue]|nr:hypothetical protein HK405_010610 [Cladochytrium tenue]